MSLYGLDHDRAFARCEADYLREPDWREPSEEELDAADAREAQRAIDDGETDAPALCRCGGAVPRSALDRVLFRFLLVGGAWTCPGCREARS